MQLCANCSFEQREPVWNERQLLGTSIEADRQGCKLRRMKCEELAPSSNGEMTCKLCREAGTDCTFETPVRKR